MIIESMLGLALLMPADRSVKCSATHHLPGFPETSPVVLIDGEIRSSEIDMPMDAIDPSDVHMVEIRCWNPDTDDLTASSGIRLILITTKSPMAEAEAQTLAAARRVHAFVAEHDEVPTSGEEIDASLEGYSIEIHELGWVLTSPDLDGIECVTSRLQSEAGEVVCSSTYSSARKALREAWERGAQAF